MHRFDPRHLCAAALLALLFLWALGCCSTRPASEAPAAPAAPVVAPAAPHAAAPADPQEQKEKNEVLAQQARRLQAMVSRDGKVLDEILRDDMTYIHSSGPLENKEQIVDEVVRGRLQYRSMDPSEQTVRIFGDTAIVAGRIQLQAKSGGKVMGFPIRFTEVWVRTQGVWQLAAWQSTRIPEP